MKTLSLASAFASMRTWRAGRRIFVSYRRADTQEIAERLYERLAEQFGATNVFMDRADIEHGERWRDEVTRQITAADMFVVLIGPTWLATLRARAKQDDVLRSELRSALEHKKQIIPVLVDGTTMPYPGQLPQEVRALTEFQALPLTAETLDRAMLTLLGRLKPGWRLAVSWAFGQFFGWVVGILILMAVLASFDWMVRKNTVQFAATYPFIATALAGALAGACVAAPQWLLLRPWFARARHLVPGYVILSAVAAGYAGSIASDDEARHILGLIVVFLPIAFAVTLGWVVSEKLRHAGWWSVANLVAPLVAVLIAAGRRSEAEGTSRAAQGSKISEGLSVLGDFFVPMILMSLAVGWLLVWLMRRSEIRRR